MIIKPGCGLKPGAPPVFAALRTPKQRHRTGAFETLHAHQGAWCLAPYVATPLAMFAIWDVNQDVAGLGTASLDVEPLRPLRRRLPVGLKECGRVSQPAFDQR